MKIEKASKKDFANIANLMLEEFSKPPFNEKSHIQDVLKSLKFYFKLGHIYISTINKKIAGVIVFKIEQYWEGQVIIIEDLAINKQFKKQRVEKMLMNYVENYAKKRKIKYIIFETHKKSNVVKFYQKQGYKQDKNVIFMGKKLK